MLALLVLVLCAPGLASAGAVDNFGQRVASVRTLIGSSSAAQRIKDSGNVQALARRDAASSLLDEAVAARTAGDLTRADRLLREASSAMLEATRLAATAPTAKHSEAGVVALTDSTRSLLAAAQRIATEQKRDKDLAAGLGRAQQALAHAEALRKFGDLAGAHAAASTAYLTAKMLLLDMRQGVTLVRSLKFANAKEEYDYELDRHDALRMILQMVRTERALDNAANAVVDRALAAAVAARSQAQAAATRGDHRAGIVALGDATQGLIAAIRRAGLYIPG